MGRRAQASGARHGGDGLAILCCALTLLVGALTCEMTPASAQAPPSSVRVDWQAPEPCPSADWVRGDIERRLGRPIESLREPTLVAEGVVVAGVGDGFQLVLTTIVDDKPGERTLADSDCPSLASAASLIIALAIDPSASQTEETPAQLTPPGTDSDEATAAAQAENSSQGGAPLGMYLRLDLIAELGALPGLAAGPAASLGLSMGRLRLEVSGLWLPPRDARLTGVPSAVADLQLIAVGIGACLQLLNGSPVEAGPCGRLEYGSMRGEGSSAISDPMAGDAGWAAAHAGGWIGIKLGSLGTFRLEVDLGLPLSSAEFTVEGVGTVHEASPVNLRSRLGVELNF